ncbi:DUF11 domain-containing protein [Pedobacter nototheniae]|uniref:DUF11 domain-containing protein n=1 Tax=Pedobacter nototheniae TaxID=2488994 RepID=UPI00103E1D77|nr:DUF11 domain-containing protein [Pedobacter nototheniae]
MTNLQKTSTYSKLICLMLVCLASVTFGKNTIKHKLNTKTYGLTNSIIVKSSKLLPPRHTKHYIAPAPWQYWSDANEIVVTAENSETINGTIKKSDGSVVTSFTCTQSEPFVYRFVGKPLDFPNLALNTVLDGAGLIVEGTSSISVNIRNIASDEIEGGNNFIKGNASLYSFGDAGIGMYFRVGYYRDGAIDYTGTFYPVYSIMAIADNTVVTIDGEVKATLNAGQSWLFNAKMGALVEATGLCVMNTGSNSDTPEDCGDGTFNPIPPISSLEKEYLAVRGQGNLTAEQSTIIATEPNTVVTVTNYDVGGGQQSTESFTLANAGDFKTINHGFIDGDYNTTDNNGQFSSSLIVGDKNIEVFAGTASGNCEVDIAALVPISICSGSKRVEFSKFTDYNKNDLDYFGYIFTKSSTDKIFITIIDSYLTPYATLDIETLPDVGSRIPLGNSGLYMIKFSNDRIGLPSTIILESASSLTVSVVQSGQGFSMSNFISHFSEKADQPEVSAVDCNTPLLASVPNGDPYQWYLDGQPIDGAISSSYPVTSSGNYSVSYTMLCGMSAPSNPIKVEPCNVDLSIIKTVDQMYPALNGNVVFTLQAGNLGGRNATGVVVNDLLPDGYEVISNEASVGSYEPSTGIWTIGDLMSNGSATLTITAKVVKLGISNSTATITGPLLDVAATNNQSSISTATSSSFRNTCVNSVMEPIIFDILPGTTITDVTGLPSGITWAYDDDTRQVTISGTPDKVGPIMAFGLLVSDSVSIPGSITVGTCMMMTNPMIPAKVN